MDESALQKELSELQTRAAELEDRLGTVEASQDWRAPGYYTAYYATTGFMLGMIGAAASLLVNVIGSVAVGQNALKIIQVYLTFGLGEQALELHSGLALAIGCCLYIGTGSVLGIIFNLVLTRYTADATFVTRVMVVTVLSLAVWVINFYAILSWLQPALFGGNWIVQEIPWYVGAGTHLVFGWTMALLYPLGLYTPYRRETEKA